MLKPRTAEQRMHMRFNKVFPVRIGSEVYGDSDGVARNISSGGMMVEMLDPLPLGSVVTIHFEMPDASGEIIARAEVKHHYCFNFNIGDDPASTRGIGVRFIEFLQDSAPDLERTLRAQRILH